MTVEPELSGSRASTVPGTEAQRLRDTLIDSAPTGLATVDVELRVTFHNPAMHAIARAVGFRGDSALGRPLREMFPAPAEQLERACRAALADGRPSELQVDGPDRAGPSPIDSWQVGIRPVPDERGEPAGLALTISDVTEHQRESARISALQSVTAALSEAGSLDEVVRVALTEARSAVAAAAASVGLLTPEGNVLRATTDGLPPTIAASFQDLPLQAPLPGAAVTRDGRPRYYPDQAALAAEFPDAVVVVQKTPYQAVAIEPLQVGALRLGFFTVLFVEPGAMSDGDRRLLTALAGQCAVAVDRARRADDERVERLQAQQLQALAALLVVATGVDDVARILANEGAALLGASIANVSTYDPATRMLTMRDASPGTPDEVTTRFARYSVDDPLPSRELFATGQPVLLSSFEERDRRYPSLADVQVPQQAWANLLLQVDGRPLGAVGFAWHDPRRFTPDEVRRMQLIADLSAGALERARLADEQRQIAETVQRGLLPYRLPRLRGWRLAARYRPAGTAALVGGDWYDAFPLPGRQLGLLIGDVAGHGVTAAALMGQVRALGRAEARAGADPATVLARLNQAVYELIHGSAETLVTCCFVQLDPRNSMLRAASAGHPPPFVRAPLTDDAGGPGAAEAAEVAEVALVPGPPLGVLSGARCATSSQLLDGGSTVLLYTDGLIERRDRALDAGVRELGAQLAAGPAAVEALCDHLLAVMLADDPAPDDVALIAARAPGG